VGHAIFGPLADPAQQEVAGGPRLGAGVEPGADPPEISLHLVHSARHPLGSQLVGDAGRLGEVVVTVGIGEVSGPEAPGGTV
jgi:hypothetical protein